MVLKPIFSPRRQDRLGAAVVPPDSGADGGVPAAPCDSTGCGGQENHQELQPPRQGPPRVRGALPQGLAQTGTVAELNTM